MRPLEHIMTDIEKQQAKELSPVMQELINEQKKQDIILQILEENQSGRSSESEIAHEPEHVDKKEALELKRRLHKLEKKYNDLKLRKAQTDLELIHIQIAERAKQGADVARGNSCCGNGMCNIF